MAGFYSEEWTAGIAPENYRYINLAQTSYETETNVINTGTQLRSSCIIYRGDDDKKKVTFIQCA